MQVEIARKALPWLLGVGFFGCATWVAMENFGFGDKSSTYHTRVSDLMAWPIRLWTI